MCEKHVDAVANGCLCDSEVIRSQKGSAGPMPFVLGSRKFQMEYSPEVRCSESEILATPEMPSMHFVNDKILCLKMIEAPNSIKLNALMSEFWF